MGKMVFVSRCLLVACLGIFLFGLFFRLVIYSRMYIAPGDPYGLSDVIEFLLGWLLIGLLALSVVVSLFLVIKGPREPRLAGTWLGGVVLLIVLLVRPLHDLAVRWAF
jgi:hypothetical protein